MFIFSKASVSHAVHGWGAGGVRMDGDLPMETPLSKETPSGWRPPPLDGDPRSVCILLECILVLNNNSECLNPGRILSKRNSAKSLPLVRIEPETLGL